MTFSTSSATGADHSDTNTVTSNGPTVNMTSWATASIAYAVCTCSSRPSTVGHSARSPPSRGGAKKPGGRYGDVGEGQWIGAPEGEDRHRERRQDRG